MARSSGLLDGALVGMLLLVALLAGVAWLRGGPEMLRAGFAGGLGLLTRFGLLLLVSFLAAGLVEVLIPR